MELKIERLEFENLKDDIKRKKDKDISMFPGNKNDIKENYNDLFSFEILPVDFIQDYLDDKTRLGWKLLQVIPIYYPYMQTNKLFGIDYYWQID
jgi:hypothetical protein